MIENGVTVGQRDGGKATKYLRSPAEQNHETQVLATLQFMQVRRSCGGQLGGHGALRLVSNAGY
jgi:hypothetical protein